MPLDLDALYASLSPEKIEWCGFKPDNTALPERKMQVWKVGNTWHFKTQIFLGPETGTFEPNVDAYVITALDKLLTQSLNFSARDVTAAIAADVKQEMSRPYLKLTPLQQKEIMASLQYEGLFLDEDRPKSGDEEEVSDVTRKAVCKAALSEESEALVSLRKYISSERLQLLGGEAKNYLVSRKDTTPAEMLRFIHILLSASAHALAPSEPVIQPPKTPAELKGVMYKGTPKSEETRFTELLEHFLRANSLRLASTDDSHAALGGYPAPLNFSGSAEDNALLTPNAPIGLYMPRLMMTESAALRSRFERLLHAVEEKIPAAERQKKASKRCFYEMRQAVHTWAYSKRSTAALLAFREASDKFFKHDVIRAHHIKSSFFGEAVSESIKALKAGLHELRETSVIHTKIKKDASWNSMFFSVDRATVTFVPPLLALINCIQLSSILPLCVFIGLTLPFITSLRHGYYLAERLWEMPSGASKDYLEAARPIWSRTPLLLTGAAVGGALLGACQALLVPGVEMAVAVSSWLAISLAASTLALILPVALVLLFRGTYSAGHAVCQWMFGKAPDATSRTTHKKALEETAAVDDEAALYAPLVLV
ncbi:MAG: hypothetical protein P1U32_00015 [Legionellaceae bacterium]|nr:hypothetical protein [Legionellaceae bacterium]